MPYDDPLGPQRLPDGQTRFLVWGQHAKEMRLLLPDEDLQVEMMRGDDGYYTCIVDDLAPGTRYWFQVDGGDAYPDPTSRAQPDGPHRPSALVDATFNWTDAGFRPPSARNTVIYELHIGTFTPAGTFEAVIPHLPRLRELGITTLEIMPIAEFPGARNWGYDGVNLYAAHSAYGGIDGFRNLVDAAHAEGLAVLLDVVYNHFGPEGNYLRKFGPYFTGKYQTPWGEAVNLDDTYSDHVRRFLIENALHWLDACHVDGFRLDATHALLDQSAYTFMEQLRDTVGDWAARHNKPILLFAEDDRSDRRLLLPREANGIGMNGVWLDELHHSLHIALTGEQGGYYADYADPALLPKVLRDGFAYTGQYSPSRKRCHGSRSDDIPTDRFVVCTQNHDQIGNRLLGERLAALTDFEGQKVAAGLVLLSPYIPLLFMGEEYGETAPFLYFISHTDERLLNDVRAGRESEFADFKWKESPPDPGAEATFNRSKLNHDLREQGPHAALYALYRDLLRLRRDFPVLNSPHRDHTRVYETADYALCLERSDRWSAFRLFINVNREVTHTVGAPLDDADWEQRIESACVGTDRPATLPKTLHAGKRQQVELPPKAFALYQRR